MRAPDFTFEAIGTAWSIHVTSELSSEARSLLFEDILHRIGEFDRNYSRFRADSLVTKMSREAGTYELPDDAGPMLELYRNLYELTGGLMTPLVGRLMEEAGYDASYSLVTRELHEPPAWETALSYEPPTLSVLEPVLLDFGAAGKGYLVDLVGGVMRKHGVRSYTIDAGSDILHASETGESLRIGLENPENTREVVGVTPLGEGALCASAGNRRTWGDFHHIIHPRLLASPKHIAGTWVKAETALLADGLATALFFVEPAVLGKRYEFDYAILSSDKLLSVSEGFSGDFFADSR